MKIKRKGIQWTKRKVMTVSLCTVLLLAAGIVAAVMTGKTEDAVVYKEAEVKYGVLTVGVTANGAVDIGTVEQTFDLDMSALRRVETGGSGSSPGSGSGNSFSGMGSGGSSFSGGGFSGGSGSMSMPGGSGFSGGNTGGNSAGITSGMGSSSAMGSSGAGGLNMFSQMLGGGGNLVGSGDDSSLTIASVKVSVGQQVAEGDVLFELAEDSVAELEKELQENVDKAKADLDAVYADNKLSRQTAQYTLDSSRAYGSYAQAEYNNTVQELEDSVESSKKTLRQAQTTLADYKNRLQDMTVSYQEALTALEKCQYSLKYTDPSEAYLYAYYYDLTEQAQQSADSLQKQKEQLESNVEQAEKNVATAAKNYNAAQRNLEKGLLSAKQTLALRQLAYSTAQETYDITIAYLEEDIVTQEEIYQETKEKWDEFSSYISGNTILSKYNGVITGVELAEGDSISTGSALITLYDMDAVSMTVSVYEDDMANIYVGSLANINFTAYPDQVFTASVSEISDASTDSRGNVLYEVTVTIDGDVSGLFQGMTGEIIFVTSQTESTLYVSKRAVYTENSKNYVKIRQEDGSVARKEVTAGFTDGTYVQILEGLSEGDVVLIESKVSGS